MWSRMERDVSLFNRFLNYDYDTRCRLPVRIYKHGAKNNNPTLPSRSSNHIHRFPFVSISRGKRGRKKKKEKAVSRINKAYTCMQRDPSNILFVLEEERGGAERQERERRRSLAFLGAKNGWMAVCQPPGGWLRNANFGCQLGTSWGGIGRGKVRERDGARREGGCVFAAYLSPSAKSHPRANFSALCRTLLPPRHFVSTFRSNFSSRRADLSRCDRRGRRRGEGRGILARPQPLLYTPSKIFGGGLDLSSSERRLRNDFIGSLTGSPIAIPVAYRNEDL